MSYRSDIGIACEENAFNKLLEVISNCKFNPYSISKNQKQEYLFFWKQAEWNYSSNAVTKIEALLKELSINSSAPEGDGFVFVRIGEELGDVEIRKNTDRIDEPITIEIRTDGYERQVELETTKALDYDDEN